jgi:hypothetical protein
MKNENGTDAPRKLLEEASNELADYQVGFVILYKNAAPEDALLAGSGTLVEIDGTYAILTADHVIENLPQKGEVGLILPTRFPAQAHRAVIEIEFSNKITVSRGAIEAEGPDLAFLTIPQPFVGTIKAKKTFYNLCKRRSRILKRQSSINEGVWLITGMVEELTSEIPPERGYERVKVFRGICGAGIIGREYRKDGFDYLEFEAKYNENYEGPQSYKGYSGGGLWQLIIDKSKDGVFQIKEKILSGVVFYQSPITGIIRSIKCHGRLSIYDAAIDHIKEVLS